MMTSRTLPALLLLFAALPAAAQEAPATEPVRPPEGSVIINLPSAEVNGPKVLELMITHRFAGAVSGSDIHSLFSFDSGADVNIGLSYVPLKNLEIALLRGRSLEDYELSAKYRFILPAESPLGLALRVGGNARTGSVPEFEGVSTCESPRPAFCAYFDNRYGFFTQAIVAVTLFSRVQITAVPTYVSRAAQAFDVPTDYSGIHKDVFNIPFAVAIAATRSVNIHGEVVPRISRANSGGVGWIVALEKTVLRHRFAFTVGNLRPTTVDQYIGADFIGKNNLRLPRDYYLGFNIVRQWKL